MQPFHCGKHVLDASRPLVMGIVNVTDDSFSGDGLKGDVRAAILRGKRLVDEGADMLDLGAESSRPGANPISADQEIDRLLPVIDGLRDLDVPLSVDTVKPAVMSAVLRAGADMINDINALRAPGAIEAVAASRAAVCLMHMQGVPANMQHDPRYDDVVTEVAEFLADRVAAAEAAGIALDRICVDPGFGFGKSLDHNLELLRRLSELSVPGMPVLVGLSRKSMIGLLTGRAVDERVAGCLAAMVAAALRGARIFRVHDVAPTRDALAVISALEEW